MPLESDEADRRCAEPGSSGRAGQFGVQICTSGAVVGLEWDPYRAANNFSKHGVRFAEAATVFEDEAALTMLDNESDEERFVALGTGSMGRILVVVYTIRGDRIRIISARKATRRERSQYVRRDR
jgi:uncharacterized protein